MRTRIAGWLVASALAVGVSSAYAVPYIVTAQLTGDPRPENPDNLIVDVTITGDTDSQFANWVIDINSPAHPNIQLDVLAFNLADPNPLNSFFQLVVPAVWEVTNPATNVPGSGNADFLFQADKMTGTPSNQGDVTNTQNLSFTMGYVSLLSPAFFTGAPDSCSSDGLLLCGQIGAHLQSLNAAQGESDSGFALGRFVEQRIPPTDIPEPGSLLLLGAALAALGLRRRARI